MNTLSNSFRLEYTSMEVVPLVFFLFLIVVLILVLVVIGRLRLSKISNKSYLLSLDFSKDRYELNDKLRAGLKSIKIGSQKPSELTRLHNKMRDSNINDSNLNIFAPDTQQIIFEMGDDENTSDEYSYSDNTSNTVTFSESFPIPITMRIGSEKRKEMIPYVDNCER